MTTRDKADLYAVDLSTVVWQAAPGSTADDRIEVAAIPGGGMALRNPADPLGAVQRYDEREWAAFLAGVRDGEFDE
ncbi:DUF397 domain-containing protein [Embleya scabrispora]|uniref:DUF397 domain-containing protein n=1 Tax=Embleya scabrispora TaxID=159449 RepID=UPI0003676FC2|nr:DUF397 domain-containing protein [Embleya scabrispora]MYS86472.1 DUF397 domain-containing protein [Streptomyces sp. SID5474]